jgi:hypothetical protein
VIARVIPLVTHGERAHSEVGASAAHRWLSCFGSVQAQRGIPQPPSGPASVNGTICHEASEFALREFLDASEIPSEKFAGLVDVSIGEAETWVRYYLDAVRAMPGARMVEARVDFSRWVPGGFGTADCVLLDLDVKRVTICDAKFGMRRVDAEDNPQLRLYALGVREYLAASFGMSDDDFLGFEWEMVIVQPRLDWIVSEVVSDETLLAFGERASEAARIALGPNPPRVPSDENCHFCLAKSRCKARADALLAKVETEFGPAAVEDLVDDVEALTPAGDLSPEEIARVLAAAPAIQRWLNDVRDYAQGQALAGDTVPGFKVVAGRSNRAWLDATRASMALEAAGFEPEVLWRRSFLSPADAERLGPAAKAIVAAHTHKPEGAPQLVPDSDNRPPVNTAKAADDFSSSR